MLDDIDILRQHLNDGHADTIGLIGSFLARGGVSDPTAVSSTASLECVEASGLDVEVDVSGAPVLFRHDFGKVCTDSEAVRVEMFGLLTAARAWAGSDIALTSLERELAGDIYSTFVTQVVGVEDITPTLRQITFGIGLDEFESTGGDQFLYVLLPPSGRSELSVDSTFSWQAYESMPESERPLGAYYTVRRWRPEARELDMWFVLHGDAGAASSWASTVEVGQPAALWGPRRVFDPPGTTTSYLFVTDETGFGAVAAVLDELIAADADVTAQVVAESDGVDGRIEFPSGAGVDVSWVDRRGRAPGTTSVLLDAVRELEIGPGVYAFGAAESRRITAVRTYLRETVGLDATQVSMTGYWRSA
ncbi:siderophore-interacting protein [Ilumatobacter nonamiensis]|uniref:siderophore-interacting protein n=1 Tax=Ilumatobacter nonamiensis TaxID=467093 RepID=UPI000344AFA2|nr:siderophore-interacting protein [Ilumatobacter nonamiensis]